MVVKEIIEENLKQKNCTAVLSLDIRGAFDAAWWPSILHNLKELKCPRNLINMSRIYFSERTASLRGNKLKIEKTLSMGCPQVSCSGRGYWDKLYNSLLNMKFSHRTRVIAFADYLLVLTRGKSALHAENYANQDLKKLRTGPGRTKCILTKTSLTSYW